jgi:predicted RNA-binding Zn-ribbon protein involved in translation (DUF1610 family)
MANEPKILLIDIETAPNKAYTWGLWNQNIGINQIVEPGYTMCWVAKWLGKKKIIFSSFHHDGMDVMVEKAWDLLDEADAVVHYNGKKFDMPTLNREFVMHEWTPPSPYWQVDLLSVCRKEFNFASNKLDYVCQQLGLGGKIQHKGMELWKECMDGKASAWKEMKEYNIRDVQLLEDLYNKLLPWIGHHPNLALWENSSAHMCPNCGSHDVVQRGFRRTNVSIYRRYRCNACGKWSRGRKQVEKAEAGVLRGDYTSS